LADPAGVNWASVNWATVGDGRLRIAPWSLFQLADAHGVLPIVVHNYLQREQVEAHAVIDPAGGQDATAESALAWAQQKLRARLVQSMVIRKQRAEIDRQFREAGIPGMVLKGEDFADNLYTSASLRFFTDLDILVRIADFDRAGTILSRLGYVRADASWQKHADSSYGEEAWKRVDTAAPFGCVELHWNLINSPSLQRSVSIAWDDLVRPHVRNDGGLQAPDWNARLLIAAAHAAVGHGFDRLTLLCDFLQAVRLGAASWDLLRLAKQMSDTGLKPSVQMSCHLSQTVFSADEIAAASHRLDLPPPNLASRILIGRCVVLGPATPLRTLRRKLFRLRLKRAG
jgi:hypothetical protein